MNIIRMTGGLGNQMFQYALYLKLRSLGKEVKMDDFTEYEDREARPIMLWCYGISYPSATHEELNQLTDGFMKLSHRIKRKLFGRKSQEYRERDCNFDVHVLQQESAYLTGYFQSERYFKDIEKLVREAFQFSDKIWHEIGQELLGKIRNFQRRIDETISVSIHIRRGDYLENEEVYGRICTDEYYKKAIELVKEKYPGAEFFIFSNEPQWAKEWLMCEYGQNTCFTVIEGTSEETGYLDMFLMSRCKHYILANSSFSWWGAWLNPNKEKIVIAPSRWFNNQKCRDIYTEGMIRISPDGGVVREE